MTLNKAPAGIMLQQTIMLWYGFAVYKSFPKIFRQMFECRVPQKFGLTPKHQSFNSGVDILSTTVTLQVQTT